MWQKQFFAQDLSTREFERFLSSNSYVAWAQQRHEDGVSINLADAIQGWLEVGNGAEQFTTYTSFLLAVISIIGEWAEDGRVVRNAPLDVVSRDKVGLFEIIEQSPYLDPLADPSGQTTFHPIMQENYFESQRARVLRDGK